MTNYKISFSGGNRGCGCGCSDNDLNIADQNYKEDFYFSGTHKMAEQELERLELINKNFGCDWGYWNLQDMTRFVLLSGPSCVGKGPLIASINNFFNDIVYSTIPVIKSKETRPRGPRPDENLIWNDPRYFRKSDEINELKDDNRYRVGMCREYPQAIDLDEILNSEHDLILVEAYHTFGQKLSSLNNTLHGSNIISSFISPVSDKEIQKWKTEDIELESKFQDIMFVKLNIRSKSQGDNPNDPNIIKNNKLRASDAYSELQSAHNYTHVLVNHYGEGHPDWNQLPNGKFIEKPKDDLWKVIRDFAELLKTGNTIHAEHWNQNAIGH